MSRALALTACLALIGLSVSGCSLCGCGGDAEETVMGKCPGCGEEMAVGQFCTKCTAVATTGEEFECKEEAGKMVKAGTYCAKTNCFRFREDIECKTCGKTVTKGSFCEEHKVYRGLPAVGYCETCKKPFAKAEGCPTCGEKA